MISLHTEISKGNKGFTIVFVHGNSQNLHFWDSQLNDSSFSGFTRVAVDLPGHGNSPKHKDYQIPNLLVILSNFLNQFGPIVIIGHSLGGHIILQSLSKIEHCVGLVLIGTPPLKSPINLHEAFNLDERMGLLFKEQLSAKEIATLIEFIDCLNNPSLAEGAIKRTDPKFRIDIANSVSKGQLMDELEILKSINFPVALMIGEGDQLINRDYLESIHLPILWKERIHYIPKTGHTPQLGNPGYFNKLLLKFLDDIHNNNP